MSFFFFLPFGDQRVGEAGGSKHSPGKKNRHKNTADFLLEFIFYFNRQLHILGWRCNCRSLRSKQVCGNLRDISQGGFELSAQIPHVLPLLLRQTLAPHVDVLHSQLLLVKQPLHNKQRG